MDKPISILINDFKMNIEKCINESNLPAAVIEPIIKDYYQQVQVLSRQQLMNDMRQATVTPATKEEETETEEESIEEE